MQSRDAAFAELLASGAASIPEPGDAPVSESLSSIAAPPVVEPATAVTPAPPVSAAAPPNSEMPGLDKLVAKEVALATERAELAAQRKELLEMKKQMDELRAAKHLDPAIARLMQTDPRAAIAQLGADPELAIQMAMAAKLGPDKIPPELKQSIENAKLRQEMAELKSQLSSRDASEAQSRYVSDAKARIGQYVTSGISPDAPTVIAVAAKNPTMVQEAIFNEIANDARSRMRDEPNGDPITHEEASRRIEAQWSIFSEALKPTATPAPTTAPVATASKTTTPPQTAAEKQTVVHKPLFYGHRPDRDAETARAVADAVAEFRRVEASTKTA
jgi:hypothetical protein